MTLMCMTPPAARRGAEVRLRSARRRLEHPAEKLQTLHSATKLGLAREDKQTLEIEAVRGSTFSGRQRLTRELGI